MALNIKCDSMIAEGTSFLVRVNFRQNASWQGTVQWLDGEKTVTFRSSMELAMLILEAMQESKDGKVIYQAPSWNDKQEVS